MITIEQYQAIRKMAQEHGWSQEEMLSVVEQQDKHNELLSTSCDLLILHQGIEQTVKKFDIPADEEKALRETLGAPDTRVSDARKLILSDMAKPEGFLKHVEQNSGTKGR